jgi:hypothetical protein
MEDRKANTSLARLLPILIGITVQLSGLELTYKPGQLNKLLKHFNSPWIQLKIESVLFISASFQLKPTPTKVILPMFQFKNSPG